MKSVLLITQELIPSAVLCGHAPLSRLAEQGRVEYRWRRPGEVRGEDIRRAQTLLFLRSDDPGSLWLAKLANRAGRCCVYILDDDLLNIPQGLESSAQYRRAETQENIRGIMGECGLLLSPSRRLLEKYGDAFPRAERIEEPALPGDGPERARRDTVTIGFAGSTDRAPDIDALLSAALRRILETYAGRVTAEFFGARPAVAEELGLRHIPFQRSYEDYRRTMGSLSWDLALAPMPETEFHRCKHYNKYIEYAAWGIPGIYSAAEPYTLAVRDGENGLLCPNTEEGWYAAMARLIEDAALRRRLGETARREAETLYSIETVAERWAALLDTAAAPGRETPELADFDRLYRRERRRLNMEKLKHYKWRAPYHAARALGRRLFHRR